MSDEKHEGCEGAATIIDRHICKYKDIQFELRTRDITEEEDAELEKMRVELLAKYLKPDASDAVKWESIPLAERLKLSYQRAAFMLGARKKLVEGPYGEGWTLTRGMLSGKLEDDKIIPVTYEDFNLLPYTLKNAIANNLSLYYFPAFSTAESKNLQGR